MDGQPLVCPCTAAQIGCGEVFTLAGVPGAGPIAVDDAHVYWAAYTSTDYATLWAQTKP